MKWPAVTVNLSKYRKIGQEAGVYTRAVMLLMTGCLLFFIALGLLGYVQSRMTDTTPSASMKGLAASVSSRFFMDMMGMEMPHLQADRKSFTFSQSNVSSFLFAMMTDINPNDPKTLISREMPVLSQDRSVPLKSNPNYDSPADYDPKQQLDTTGKPGDITELSQQPAPSDPQPDPQAQPQPQPSAQPPKTAGKNVAFIYQSHNQESYLPELPGVKDPDLAYDAKTNITNVGLRLAMMLEKEGIGAVHSNKNYPASEKDFKYHLSYKYSLKTLQEASAGHPDLKYYFDIHRDSQRRDRTTVKINGQDYAQVFFIIGGKNPNWKQNYELAEQVHHALEQKFPGISKGIHAKSVDGNGVYNQNFSPNSLLIEVGGVDNSFEECYRTADALAVAIAEVINNVEKVNAPADNKETKTQS
ncbi:stage II sporulation protein P [Paenibacillus sp. GD4]|uniref:stage II sporulation protein P n=1 Tax=Paenibacillus sp. GD4 TaxID=3068890 RepID=UPI002796DDD8|nr:stage II sporulation protein P [Paenibacillus sp. GD4]MDQ1912887.1 stage II sporulation protein P [Paenibacillus sp. GD4]